MNAQDGQIRLILNEEAYEKFGAGMKFYHKVKGFVKEYETLQDLADELEVDIEVLLETLEVYNEGAHAEEDAFDKKVFPVLYDVKAKIFAAKITPVIHYTMGGLRINDRAQVLDDHNKVMTGLYAAGEVAGGVHGHNRLAGNSLLECVVFGRIAGQG